MDRKAVAEDPKHTCLELFLKARNRKRLRFCLLVANHRGYEIRGTENWKAAGEAWMGYFKDEQYLTVGGKPLVIVFNAAGGDKAGFAAMQEGARKAGLQGLAIAGCGGGRPADGFTHLTRYNVVPGYAAPTKGDPGGKYLKALKSAASPGK